MSLIYIGIASVAAASLLYEVALTRLFSIAHGYHFAFLAITIGLMGFGASGTALALRSRPTAPGPAGMARLVLGAAAALPAGYLVADRIPFDPYRVAREPAQLVLLAGYLLSLAAPFLLVGLVLALPLVSWPWRAGPLYGANLAGSGVGSLLALVVLDRGPAPNAVLAAALLASGGALAFAATGGHATPAETARSHGSASVGSTPGGSASVAPGAVAMPGRRLARGEAVVAITAVAICAVLIVRSPSWLDVHLSPYKPLSQLLNLPDARVLYEGSSARSRVDVVEASSVRSAPGLSLRYEGKLPPQTAVVVDGEIVHTLTAARSLDRRLSDSLPTALGYRLRPGARALVLQPGGGLDVLVALAGNARSVTVVEEDPSLADLIGSRFSSRAGSVYTDPRVRLVVSTPRSYLAATEARFDVIVLSLSESFRPVTAGAFSLSETYALTEEAFHAYLEHLAPGGLLVVHRWLQLPPTEELRAAAAVAHALSEMGERPESDIVAVRSFSTMLILAKVRPFEGWELRSVTELAEARGFDLVHYPGMRPSEANRFNVLSTDVYYESFRALLADPQAFFDRYEYDVRPATDDRPFFFHFFKWEQTGTVLALLGKTWQPFGGSGYLIVLALLLVVTALSVALVLAPVLTLMRRQRQGLAEAGGWVRPLVYFAGLGLGFLLVEVALVQRSIAVLDHAAQAFAVVLFGLLISSGVGSMLSTRLPWRPVLAILAATVVAYAWLLPTVSGASLGHGLPARVLATLALLAPLGLLMGVPFARGLRALGDSRPSLVPLAWGVNAFASVIGAVLAPMIALSWGFTFVLAGGALAYLLALAAVWRSA